MKKYSIIFLSFCIVITILIVSGVFKPTQKVDDRFPLTDQQKTAIKKAQKSGKDLSDAEIDTFTIGQGKQLLEQYMKKKHVHYRIGSQKYIEYLNEISIDKSTELDGPKFTIMDMYASVYVSEFQEHMDSSFSFHLKSSTLNKTVKQIRHEQEKKDKDMPK